MKKEKDIVVKSIAFNRADPDQLEMLNHALKRTNFSNYVKRLIQRDMERLNKKTFDRNKF